MAGKRAASPSWSDGIHYVRAAAPTDPHPMRWLVKAHRVTESKHTRHAPDRKAAIEIAAGFTKRWLKDHPGDRAHLKEATVPQASSKVVQRDLPPFATTSFNCVYANPYAQVWKCFVDALAPKPAVGRPRKDRSQPKQADYRHKFDQCAVMIGDQPVRDKDGQVSVFSHAAAEELAEELYANAPEDEVISWRTKTPTKDFDVRVAATGRIEVHFNPAVNGEKRPFSLYIPEFDREVYEDRTRPTHYRDEKPPKDPQARLRWEEARAERHALDRQDSFEERPLRFRSIWAAEEEAYRRERMMKGLSR